MGKCCRGRNPWGREKFFQSCKRGKQKITKAADSEENMVGFPGKSSHRIKRRLGEIKKRAGRKSRQGGCS